MRNKQIKIGLIGGLRAGKDTVAELLMKELVADKDRLAFTTAFSDGITEVIRDYFPELLEGGKPREAYQLIGQTFRQLNPDIWINRTLDAIRGVEVAMDAHFIVKDVRQPNEALALKANGFTLVKVVADTDIRIDRATQAGDNFAPEHLQHETEIAVEECIYDYVINNSGSLQDLKLACADVLLQMTVGGYEDFE